MPPTSFKHARSMSSRTKAKRPSKASNAKNGTASEDYSRHTGTSGYMTQRRKRSRKKKILIGVIATLSTLFLAGIIAVVVLVNYMDNALRKDFDVLALEEVLVERTAPDDPFWVLMVGTDNRVANTLGRTDTIILARIDPGNDTVALVSIPRDTRITFEGYGIMKINAAYVWGEIANGHTGPEYTIRAVSELTGVGIAGYVELDFEGFKGVVDTLGGVEVNVPMNIYDFDNRGSSIPAIYAGKQVLTGDKALILVRSRSFPTGDYQRQANQRLFLQALAKQILSADLIKMTNSLTKICQMTSTTLSLQDIVALATSLRGIKDADIHSYMLTCYSYTDPNDNLSYEVPDMDKLRDLFAQLEQGVFPAS